MKTHFFSSLRITLFTMVLFGIAYPLVITAIAKISAPNGGKGVIIEVDNQVVGFELIGQSFESDHYFNGRPSAVGYNAAAAGGSNKGPTNADYLTQVEERIDTFLAQNPSVKRQEITIELVTASGGGLDPHISPRAAEIQIPRIAKARGIQEAQLVALVEKLTEGPLFGLFGTSRINVLKINVALDQISK